MKKLFLTSMVCVVVFWNLHCSGSPKESLKKEKFLTNYFTLKEAKKLVEDKKYQEAFKIIEGKAANSSNETLKYNYASLLLLNQKAEESKQLLSQIYAKKNKTILENTLFSLGNIAFLNKDFETAIPYYREVLLLNAENYNAKHNLELALLQQEQQQKDKQDKKEDQQNEKDQKNQKDKQDEQKQEQQQNQSKESKSEKSEKKDQQQMTPQKAQQLLDALKQQQGQLQKHGQKRSQKEQRDKNANRATGQDW